MTRRRTFLRAATVAGGAAVAGAGIDHALSTHAAPGVPASALTPDDGAWQTVATSAELPDGAVRPFTAGAITGFVERAGGRLRAVSGICTHQGCRLALAAGPARLVCPCHGATFALDGAVLAHRLSITLAALPLIDVRGRPAASFRSTRSPPLRYPARPSRPGPPPCRRAARQAAARETGARNGARQRPPAAAMARADLAHPSPLPAHSSRLTPPGSLLPAHPFPALRRLC